MKIEQSHRATEYGGEVAEEVGGWGSVWNLGRACVLSEYVCVGGVVGAAGSLSNSQLKGVIESGGGEERDALREHLYPLSLTLRSSYLDCGDLCLLMSTSSSFSFVAWLLMCSFFCLYVSYECLLQVSASVFYFPPCLLHCYLPLLSSLFLLLSY